MINIEVNKPMLIVGKPGTGKTTKAHEILDDDFIVRYANEYDLEDNFSIPLNVGILIEEVHHKPNIDLIVDTLLQFKGKIVLTSLNQKDVPKRIFNLCKLKRAGTTNYLLKARRMAAPNADDPVNYDMNIFELLKDYLRNSDRESVLTKLKMNKPFDEQLLSWLAMNIHPNKIAYIDSKVKRKWSQDYFYELLAYAFNGNSRGLDIPSKRTYSKVPSICRRIGLKSNESYILEQLLEDEDFTEYVKKRVNNTERRVLNLSEKKRTKKVSPKQKGLEEW